MRLSLKLAVLLGISFVAGAFTLAGILNQNIQSSLQDSIGERQLEFGESIFLTIDQILYQRLRDIAVISKDETIENFLRNPTAGARGEVKTHFSEFMLVTGPWDDLFMADASGKILFSTDRENIGASIATEPENQIAYEAAMAGTAYYSDVVLPRDTAKPTVVFAAPVRDLEDPKRPIIGVAIGHFSWPAVLDVLRKHTGEFLRVRLYNRDDVFLGSENPAEYSEILKSDNHPIFHHPGELEKAHRGTIISSTNVTGQREQSLFSFVHQNGYLSYRGSGWHLIVETPTAVAFALARSVALEMIAVLAAIWMVEAVIAIFLLRKLIVRPILELTATSRRMSEGDLTQRVAIHSRDEIGELANAFNHMTEKITLQNAEITNYSRGLEQKVAERTEELAGKVAELEQMNKLMIGRELKMVELKKEIEEITKKSGDQSVKS